MTYAAAETRGAELMRIESTRRGFALKSASRLDYRPTLGAYRYTARTSLDIADGGGTAVWFSAKDGRQLGFAAPPRSMIDRIGLWADALHEAEVFGLPYRLFVSVFGLLITGLTVTGVLIWTKKHSAGLRSAERRLRK